MSENDDIVSTCGNQFRLLEEHESIQSMNIANSPQCKCFDLNAIALAW